MFSQTQGVCSVHQIDNGEYSFRPMTPGYLNYTQPDSDDQPSLVKLNATYDSTPVIKLCKRWNNTDDYVLIDRSRIPYVFRLFRDITSLSGCHFSGP